MEKPQDSKKKSLAVFWEEFSRSSFLVILLAVFTGIVLGGVLVAITTNEVYAAFRISFWSGLGTALKTAWNTYVALFTGSVGDPEKIGLHFQVGIRLLFVGRSIHFLRAWCNPHLIFLEVWRLRWDFRAGLFNIGVEGQIFIGAVTGVWAGYAITGLPAIIHIPVAMLFGAIGGALWGFIPGILKAKTGAHEVITTIMMNYIAFRLVDWLLKFPMKDPNEFTPKTPWILETAKLPRFFDTPIRFHLGFFIAILMAVLVYLLLFKTTWGFELRMVGSNPNAARYAGVKITKTTVLAMVLSSALAGMAGANEVLGINYRLLPAFSSGYGFDSIALALLGKTHPLGVILSSLLFGFLRNGARSMQLQ